MMKYFLFLLFLFSQVSIASLENTRALLDGIQTYNALFEQTTETKDGAVVNTGKGNFVFLKPGHFFWELTEIDGEESYQLIKSNQKTIWHYDEELEQVVVQNYQSQKLNSPVLVMLENTDAFFDEYKLVRNETEGDATLIVFKPEVSGQEISSLSLRFISEKLSQIVFLDNFDHQTTISFQSVHQNESIEFDSFEFEITDDMDVIYE
jgi:chaperone LolA